MSEAKHTPGPWHIEGGINLVGDPYSKVGQHALYTASIRHGDYVGSVCSIQSADHCSDVLTREAAEANAHLIAAAPDLLDALKGALNHWAVPSSICIDRPAYEKARAAIAKATGQKQ